MKDPLIFTFSIFALIGLYVVVKRISTSIKNDSYWRGYYKGKEDCLEELPKEKARLKELSDNFDVKFHNDIETKEKIYRVGLLDGAKCICDARKMLPPSQIEQFDIIENGEFSSSNFKTLSNGEYGTIFDNIEVELWNRKHGRKN